MAGSGEGPGALPGVRGAHWPGERGPAPPLFIVCLPAEQKLERPGFLGDRPLPSWACCWERDCHPPAPAGSSGLAFPAPGSPRLRWEGPALGPAPGFLPSGRTDGRGRKRSGKADGSLQPGARARGAQETLPAAFGVWRAGREAGPHPQMGWKGGRSPPADPGQGGYSERSGFRREGTARARRRVGKLGSRPGSGPAAEILWDRSATLSSNWEPCEGAG